MKTVSSVLVLPGDIIIGKITPKGETDPTPEEKLLRAIFGDKAGDVKDASLKASPSLRGVIIGKELYCKAIKTRKDRVSDKEILDLLVVFDDTVVNHSDLAGIGQMGMAVHIRGCAMGGPTGVPNADLGTGCISFCYVFF